jgi:uncharacterized protein (TIGR03067 family)
MKPLRFPSMFIQMATLLLVIALPTSTNADDPPPPSRQAAKDDLKKLQGAWVCVGMEREGDEIPAESYQGSEVAYEDDRVTLFRDGGVFRRGLVTLDPSKTPKRINTWDLSGPYEDQTVPGIYAIDGDTLKLCFSRPGAERPADFSTKKGSGLLSIVYKRKKP